MTSLKDYKEQYMADLKTKEDDYVDDDTLLVAYEISNLTDAIYKLIDMLEKK